MVSHNATLRVFWPLDIARPGLSGVLVGWRNSSFDLLVVSVLEDVESRTVESALKAGFLYRDSQFPVDRILERCGLLQLQVLGLLNPDAKTSFSVHQLVIRVRQGDPIPHVEEAANGLSDIQLITFKRPLPVKMQYMSLEPITLALSQNFEKLAAQGLPADELDTAEQMEERRLRELATKLKQHSILMFKPTQKETILPVIVNQINCCFEIDGLLQQNVNLIGTRVSPSLSFRGGLVKWTSNLWVDISHTIEMGFSDAFYQTLTIIAIYILMAIRIVGEAVMIIIGRKFGAYAIALKDVSATAQQLDLRLQQFSYWPIQYLTLRERRNNWKSITDNHAEYIRFFNSLWLVANDVIIGVAIGSFILQNADLISIRVNNFIDSWATTGLHQCISWLTRNPGGLKLNNELAQFLGNLFQWVIEYWASGLRKVQPMLPLAIRFIGLASFGGATFPTALCSDMLSLLTLHIHSFYVTSARIYHWQLLTIYSLFHLFRGKKRNVLRNRIDSCDYELDQLLLGTVLFTLLSFLLPTILVFYSSFAFARSAIIILKALLDTILAALNHFPLFALMLRLKDPRRLPGGVRFELQKNPFASQRQNSVSCHVSYISLKATPLSISEIFDEYTQFGSRIRRHYFSLGFFSSFATGKFVPSLHRKNLYGLQYSILPSQRISIRELWKRLNGASTSKTRMGQSTNGHLRKAIIANDSTQRRH